MCNPHCETFGNDPEVSKLQTSVMDMHIVVSTASFQDVKEALLAGVWDTIEALADRSVSFCM